MKKIKQLFLAVALVLGLGLGVGYAASDLAYAAPGCSGAKDCIGDGVDKVNSGPNTSLTTLIKNVVNVLLFIVGVASVVMIIIGGLRYTTSGGDASNVTAAKNTILYAIVGLVVASLAFAIVNFVVDKL